MEIIFHEERGLVIAIYQVALKEKGKGKIRYRERRGRRDSLKKFGGTDARILHYVAFVTNESRLI